MLIFCIGLLYTHPAWAQYDAELPAIVTTHTMRLNGDVEEVWETYNDMQADDGKGAVTEKVMYAFDKTGRLAMKTNVQYGGKKNKDTRTTAEKYHYDKEGNIASVAMYEEGKREDSIAMFYDGHNRLMRKWTFDAKDRVQKRVQYTWSKRNQLMTVRHKTADNEIERLIKISYSDDGSTVEETYHDRELKMLYRIATVTTPDTAGGKRVMRFEYNKPDTCTGMVSYATDKEGRITEQTKMDGQKNVTEYGTTAYDAYGNPDSVILYTAEKWRIHYLHTYDEHKNWTVQAVYKNNMPHYTKGRVILYRRQAAERGSIIVNENGSGQ